MEKGLQAKLRMGVIEEDDIQLGDENYRMKFLTSEVCMSIVYVGIS